MTQQQHIPHELPQFPQSFWLASTTLPSFPSLEEDIHVDAAVVGAGMTGVVTAYLLAEQGLSVALLDAGRVLNGTTGHTTAKITAQHGLIYDEFMHHFGAEQTRLYYEANTDALNWIKETVSDLQISCDFTEQDAYIYTSSEGYLDQLMKEYKAYEQLGIPGAYVEKTPLPIPVEGAVVMNNQARFHPLSFLSVVLDRLSDKGVRIYENTTALNVTEGTKQVVNTKQGAKVQCDYVISCTHFPFYDAGGFYFAKLHAERSYVLGMKTEKPLPQGMYISAEEPKRSLRTAMMNGEQLLLIGGESHQTGQGICTIKHYEALQTFGEQFFGVKEIVYRWSAQDLISLDKLPYIGPADSNSPNVLVATGFKKWGMTTSVAAAQLLTKQVTGQKSPYSELFKPSRFQVDPSLRTLLVEGADVAKHLVQGKLEMVWTTPEELDKDQGSVVQVNGKRAGAYRDLEGRVHLVDTTCTHMGCEVEWNEGERTWDCPCHGSRFSYAGEVLEGPAKKPLASVHEKTKVLS